MRGKMLDEMIIMVPFSRLDERAPQNLEIFEEFPKIFMGL